jgi:hypothetical protein
MLAATALQRTEDAMGARKTARTSKGSSNPASNVVAQARSGRRSGWLWIGATVAVCAAILVAVIISVGGPDKPKPDTATGSLDNPPATVAVGADTSPPWPAPSDATAAVRTAGLPMMSTEGQVEHIHAHLDVLVDGKSVPVPADIGIDLTSGRMSALHTHDDSGVIHIEAPARRQFSMGEFFTEWGVSLSDNNIGALRAGDGKTVRLFVNGTQRTGNPAATMFGPHDEVALVYGVAQPGEDIPTKYEFAEGE